MEPTSPQPDYDPAAVTRKLKNWAQLLGGFGAHTGHTGHTQSIGTDRIVRCDCGDHVPTPVPPGKWRGQ